MLGNLTKLPRVFGFGILHCTCQYCHNPYQFSTCFGVVCHCFDFQQQPSAKPPLQKTFALLRCVQLHLHFTTAKELLMFTARKCFPLLFVYNLLQCDHIPWKRAMAVHGSLLRSA